MMCAIIVVVVALGISMVARKAVGTHRVEPVLFSRRFLPAQTVRTRRTA